MDIIKKERRLQKAEKNRLRKVAEEKEEIKKVQLRENVQILSSQEVFTAFIIWILRSLDSIKIRKFRGKFKAQQNELS